MTDIDPSNKNLVEETAAETPPPSRKGILFLVALGLLLAGLSSAGLWLYLNGLPVLSDEKENQQLDIIEQRLDTLERALQEAVSLAKETPDMLANLENEVQNLKTHVAAKSAQESQPVQGAVAATIAFWDLRDAAKDGQSFDGPLSRLRIAFANNPSIDPLLRKIIPFASTSTPTFDQLLDTLRVEEAKIPAETTQANTPTWWDKIKKIFRPLITVRPRHDPRFAALENALATQNVSAIKKALSTLNETAQSALAPWIIDVEKRIALDTLLKELNIALSTLSAPTGKHP